jgi:hypothetical protein
MIEYRNIMAKGKTSQPFNGTVYNADIVLGKSIRLFGTHQHTPFDVSFELGGTAEYDSYNLSYSGPIVKISANTITIDQKSTGRGNKRLSLYEFCWRNYDYDAAKIAAKNNDTMQYI